MSDSEGKPIVSTQLPDLDHLQDAPPPLIRRLGWYPDPLKESDLRWWNGNEWASHVRPFDMEGPDKLTIWGIILGVFLPIVGMLIGVVLLTRNKVGPGLACLATSCLGAVVWLAFTAH
jgi:hypothetical protein